MSLRLLLHRRWLSPNCLSCRYLRSCSRTRVLRAMHSLSSWKILLWYSLDRGFGRLCCHVLLSWGIHERYGFYLSSGDILNSWHRSQQRLYLVSSWKSMPFFRPLISFKLCCESLLSSKYLVSWPVPLSGWDWVCWDKCWWCNWLYILPCRLFMHKWRPNCSLPSKLLLPGWLNFRPSLSWLVILSCWKFLMLSLSRRKRLPSRTNQHQPNSLRPLIFIPTFIRTIRSLSTNTCWIQ